MKIDVWKMGFLVMMIGMMSCVDPYDPNIDEGVSVLVVDGAITDLPGPYTVKLSKSTDLLRPLKMPYPGCTVAIEDNMGHSEELKEVSEGMYQTDSTGIQGVVGRKYRLIIQTPDGEVFTSAPETLLKGVGIADVYPEHVQYTDPEYPEGREGYRFYLDTETPPTDTNYYMWSLTSTYKFRTDFNIYFYFDGQLKVFPDADSLAVCYRTEPIKELYTLNTAEQTQPTVHHMALNFEDTYSKALTMRYSLLARQYTLHKDAYTYWNKIKLLYENQGSLYEHQPFPVRGNVVNETHPDIPAYGYFMVAGVSEKRIFVDRLYTAFHYDVCVIGEPEMRAYSYIRYTRPIEWPVYVTMSSTGARAIVNASCVDCRVDGDLEKPSFWIE
ncbi:MAG: DUF4249 domain-containing protein [Flavobacteriales bacterium]|nr:DUF4249 domain-containing protein [Flavobacteriales bacterium]MCB9449634.1 DUF4249 domain-containing protein [Flavobacteriales bacterium]